MRAMDPSALAALARGHVVLVSFVKFDFPGATIALNSSNWDFDWWGVTYLGAEGLGEVSQIEDRPGSLPGMQFQLQRVDSSYIALALDDADQIQGSPVTISTAILDSNTYQILDVVVDWVGKADTMPIQEDGKTTLISLTAESKAVDLLRGQALLYSDSDQRSLYAGDRAFEYIASQVDSPVVWPAREWFLK